MAATVATAHLGTLPICKVLRSSVLTVMSVETPLVELSSVRSTVNAETQLDPTDVSVKRGLQTLPATTTVPKTVQVSTFYIKMLF